MLTAGQRSLAGDLIFTQPQSWNLNSVFMKTSSREHSKICDIEQE